MEQTLVTAVLEQQTSTRTETKTILLSAAPKMEKPVPIIAFVLGRNAVMPSRGSKGAAGLDLSASADTKVPARGKAIIPTEVSPRIRYGYYSRVAPRSGMAWKNFTDIGAGVIDSDYRGDIGVVMFNHSENDLLVKKGDRVAQLITYACVMDDPVEIKADNDESAGDATARGAGGFGSTGV